MAKEFHIQLRLSLGRTAPSLAPRAVMAALRRLEMITGRQQRSGFELSLDAQADRTGADFDLLDQPGLAPFERIVAEVVINGVATVALDGVVTRRRLTVSPSGAELSIMGEDLTLLMDLEEKVVQHAEKPAESVARALIGGYGSYGIKALVKAGTATAPAQAVQRGTDRDYLLQMADRYGFDFYLEPGPKPGKSTAYWGPPVTSGRKQPTMQIGVGVVSNVREISFVQEGLVAYRIVGNANDGEPVKPQTSSLKPLGKTAALKGKTVRVQRLDRVGGLSLAQAKAKAQGEIDRASLGAVRAEGRLLVHQYGATLSPYQLVGVSGAGQHFDGDWLVDRVTTRFEQGELSQDFVLTREGTGKR